MPAAGPATRGGAVSGARATALAGGRRVLRSEGPGGLVRSGWQYLNAVRQLRRANRLGIARLRGRVIVQNRGYLAIGNRVRLNGAVYPIQLSVFGRGRLEIEDQVFINYGCDISAVESVTIGRGSNIGQFAIVIDCDYHDLYDHTAPGRHAPVVIEEDVWLAARVTVLPGSHIGKGSVIAAHAVVSGYIPPYSLAAGVPARVIRDLRQPGTPQVAVPAG
ncbi:MAG: acyltransferase [Dehalococcoidia bacterium]|nr:acyltransferase [Dehalococcoidia bacterium]